MFRQKLQRIPDSVWLFCELILEKWTQIKCLFRCVRLIHLSGNFFENFCAPPLLNSEHLAWEFESSETQHSKARILCEPNLPAILILLFLESVIEMKFLFSGWKFFRICLWLLTSDLNGNLSSPVELGPFSRSISNFLKKMGNKKYRRWCFESGSAGSGSGSIWIFKIRKF